VILYRKQSPVPEIFIQAPRGHDNMATAQPILPSGLKLPQLLKIDENIVTGNDSKNLG